METSWQKITISEKQIADGIIEILRDKFNIVYDSNNKPNRFTCFFKAKSPTSSTVIYLSPEASIDCESIIDTYNPTECEPPNYLSLGFFAGNRDFSFKL